MTIEETKRARGWVLQILAMSPLGADDGGRLHMSSELVVPQMRALGLRLLREEVERLFVYLEGKRYVEIRRVTSAAAKTVFGGGAVPLAARLTSTGQDLVDGTITDEGVDLGQ